MYYRLRSTSFTLQAEPLQKMIIFNKNIEREDMAPKYHYPKGEVCIFVLNLQDKSDFSVLIILVF